MTDKQINKAIAEACEWKGHPLCKDMAGNPFPGWDEPPNYCNDLNEMHEAEKVLLKMDNSQAYWYTYSNKLTTLLGCTDMFHATARERAEAFLKVIGKWEELTDKQIEVAIAEAMGWEYCDGWNSPNGEESIPDFCTDPKAMFKAEMWLLGTDDISWDEYFIYLGEHYGTSAKATIRERAEAMARILRKWKE